MQSKTFFDEVKEKGLILERGDTIDSIDSFRKMGKKTDKIGEKYAEKVENVFDSVDFDKYYVTANPINVIAERRALVELHRTPNDSVYAPKCLTNKPDLLMELYRAVYLKGKVYDKRHNDVARAIDTKNYILKKDGYKVEGRGYHEKKKGLVRIGDGNKWAREKDTVYVQDMGYRWHRGDCYKYHNDEGDVEWYRYRNLAPDAGRRILRFNEAQFPKPDDINESRIGIELEYKSAVDASVAVLKSKRYRRIWESTRDGSIVPDDVPREQEKATEFVSIPLTIGQAEREISDFMNFVKRHGARTHKTCGFHVHIGKPGLDFHDLTSVVVLSQNLEKDLFRLVPDHRQNNEYCKRLDNSFKGFNKYLNDDLTEDAVAEHFYEGKATAKSRARQGKWNVRGKRHYWLSVDRFWYCRDEPHKRTVEFRMHHSTHNATNFLQFVVLCYYIAQYAFDNSPRVCQNATLDDVIRNIPNMRHKQMASNLLKSKKVIS